VPDPSETPEQRRTRYLRLASEAEELASRCRDSVVRDAYLALAKSWKSLAAELAPKSNKPT
jgi:hypothetical protein